MPVVLGTISIFKKEYPRLPAFVSRTRINNPPQGLVLAIVEYSSEILRRDLCGNILDVFPAVFINPLAQVFLEAPQKLKCWPKIISLFIEKARDMRDPG